MDVMGTTAAPVTGPGRSAQAIGQIAKRAVAEARAAGVDIPAGAQGMAASAIARGAEPGSVFMALLTPEPANPADAGTEVALPVAAGDAQVPTDRDDLVVDVISDILSPQTDVPAQGAAGPVSVMAFALDSYSFTATMGGGMDASETALNLLEATV